MGSGEQTQPCQKCGAPRHKGLVGMVTKMCLSCARTSYPAEWATSTQEQEATAGTGTDGPGQAPQSEAEEATGDDKGEGAMVESTDNRKRRIRPTAAKGADGKKLTPACASCKRSKTRCTHRRVIDTEDSSNVPSKKRKRETSEAPASVKDDAGNDNDTSAEVGADDQIPPSKKKTLRIRWKDTSEEEAPTGSQPRPAESEPADSSKRQTRGGRRKRKLADVEEEEEEEPADASDSNAAAAVSDARVGTAEGTKPPRKRSKRGRKPNKERDASVEEIDSDAAPVPGADSAAARPRATALGVQASPPFPTDSLKGAAQLSMHTVLSRQLQERLEDCETKWLAAIESLQAAKETLDSWVEVWRKGL